MQPFILEQIYARVPQLLGQIAVAGNKRLALYGAGEHSAHLLKTWRALDGPPFSCILTTQPPPQGTRRFDLPVVGIEQCSPQELDAVVLSSHNYEYEMSLEVTKRMPAVTIYQIHDQARNNSWITQQIVQHFLGGEKITIFDIGALGIADLIQANQFWPAIPRSHLRIVAFEPDEEECRRIEEGCRNAGIEVTAIARALGARRGRSQLYLAATRSGSSVYPPDLNTLSRYRYGSKRFDRHMATERQFPIDVDSLDAVCREYNLPVPDFIKINAEGSELDIINGGMESIRHAGGMQVELTFIPKFIGGCLFSDVDPVLRGAGYEFCDILTLNQFVPDTEALDFNSFAENTLLTWGPLGAGRKFTSAKFEGHFLYFNRTTAPTSWTHEHGLKALKTACLQEGFGHPAAAFQMLENLSRIAPDEMRHKLQDLLKEARLYFRRRGVASVE